MEYNGITIDIGRDSYLKEKGLEMLTRKGFYKKDGEDTPQKTFARSATAFCFGDYELAQRIYNYTSKGWMIPASPVISTPPLIEWPSFSKDEFDQAGDWLEENVNPEGQPISCFLSMIPDSKEGLVESRKEQSHLSMSGGGVGNYFGIRAPDEKSTGVMAHAKGYDADALAYKQSESRRGSIASYLDITHPEIMPFIRMRDSVSGEANQKCFNLNNAVNLTDDFMSKVCRDEDYELVDPKHGSTGVKLGAKEVFMEVMEMRNQTGEPYCNFIDNVNRKRNPWITKSTYHVSQSNLCNEIHLMTSDKRTAVCCLTPLNLDKYDEWKDTDIEQDLVRFLDNVLEYFIRTAPKELKRAVHSASQERAIGIGTLGWHSYLQRHGIPFESGGFNSAAQHTHEIYSHIKNKAIEGSKLLAEERGEPEDCLGGGMRNSHLMAIAPNVSTADLLGVSPSIEPWKSNCFASEGRAGVFLVKNPHLEVLADKLGINTKEFWSTLEKCDGDLEELPENYKSLFSSIDFKVFRVAT